MAALPKPALSEQEYLEMERASEERHEYYDGEIFAMAGASMAHSRIITSISFSLFGQLRDRPCDVVSSETRVRVSATGLYTYPDLVIVCGTPQFADEHVDTLMNPTVLIEVLSPSTESYDRGKKFQQYRALSSLREYLLVAQDAYHIDHFVRDEAGIWRMGEADGPADVLHLPSIACDLPLADVYQRVPLGD